MKTRSGFIAIPDGLAQRARAGIQRLWIPAFAGMTMLGVVHADQYKSEVRELESTPSAAPQQDPQKLLQQTTDPYARALLLRDLASQAVQKKDYEAAAKYLQQAINEKSLSGPALEQLKKDLTQLHVASGKPSEVIKALEPMVRNNPQATADQQAALAGAYLELKRYSEALPLLQKAIGAVGTPDESWLQGLYAAMLGAGRERDTGNVLERLMRMNPGRREYWMQAAGLQIKEGDKEKGLALLELAARQGHLKSADERLQVVSLTAKAGAPFEAGSLMQGWMEAGQIPKNAGNWESLAGLWVDARESALAVNALTQCLELAPRAELFLQLGQLHMNREEYGAAASALERGLQGGSRNGQALLMLGMAYFQTNNLEAAARALKQAAGFPATKQAAEQWLGYLDTEEARAAAVQSARRKARASEQQATLSRRLLGAEVEVAPILASAGGATAAPDLRRVGGRLTPVGAERDGNEDGSIPGWDGGLGRSQWPASFKAGGRLQDPFASEKPLYTITQANAAQYAQWLTAGHKTLLSKHPTYRMPVYPTHRSAAYPQEIYDASQANIGKAKLVGSDGLTGARLGFPFPTPQNGVEVMWNHRVRYRGNSVAAQFTQAVVRANGEVASKAIQKLQVLYRYANVRNPSNLADDNVLLYFLGRYYRSNNSLDFVVLVHETANVEKGARGIWVVPPNVPKMFRIPPVGYDQPYPGSEAMYFVDMLDMYNGAFDRYVWKLVGKREMIIPYNAYRISDGKLKYAQLLTPKHFNQDATRYERHRVWVVEATERGGTRHSFGKRIFYVDEDSWNVVLVENFDREGRPWRFQEGHLVSHYEALSTNAAPTITYDLKDGRYFAIGLSSEDPPVDFDAPLEKRDFTPATVESRNVR